MSDLPNVRDLPPPDDPDQWWFTMPPNCVPMQDCDTACAFNPCRDLDLLPAVGAVLANTRTDMNDARYVTHQVGEPPIVWADPPFLQVVEVRQFTKDEQWRPGVVIWSHYHDTWVIPASGSDDKVIVGDLPGAVPGGWAIRVEPTVCPNDCERFGHRVPGYVYGSAWAFVPCQTCQGPPPTGQPLNTQP